MNLYLVNSLFHGYSCFVFDSTRNKAKYIVSREFDDEYIDMRCFTLVKGLDVPAMIVTCSDDDGYDIVKSFGYEYT